MKSNSMLGWIPDIPDNRDYRYTVPRLMRTAPLPVEVDLREKFGSVYDQGKLGSCTAQAICAAFTFLQENKAELSRLFLYFNERVMIGTVDEDSGAMIRDGMKSAARQGICCEHLFPYHEPSFKSLPSGIVYDEALSHQILKYMRLTRLLLMFKSCLAAGFPFVFGFSVYESFLGSEIAGNGEMRLPERNESLVGGHAVVAVGYHDRTRNFIVRNSWGKGWGKDGYFLMPYAYLLQPDLSDDFWTIRLVEDPNEQAT